MLSKRLLVGVRLNLQMLVVLFMLVGTQAFAVDPEVDESPEAVSAGKAIFKANCSTCHKLDEKYIGPSLRGVTERRDPVLVKSWIKNSQAMIASGDAYAVALYKEYNNSIMPAYAFLSDVDLENILSYIEYGDKVDQLPQRLLL